MKYRREIDGLRALAVLPVILFHAGFKTFSGGFVGVDVFFVISGYLITSIILAEKEAGTFTLVKFYERRARRILPALFLVMAACLPFAWLWLFPRDMKSFSQSLVAVSVFASNVLFWRTSGYFDTAAELKPLLHTWSLGVEEQYYVFFPILIILTWLLGKRWIPVMLGVVGVVSFVAGQWISATNPTAAFFLLPTRGWELVIGALVAFSFFNQRRWQPTRSLCEVGGSIGLGLLLYAVFCFDSRTPFPSLYSLAPTVGTALVILFATPITGVGKLLGNKLFVGIGLISYSAYLWHQPLLAFARHRSIDQPSIWLLGTLAIASLALAYFSWKYVEMPFRNKARFTRRTIFTCGALGSLFFITFGLIGQFTYGYEFRLPRNQRDSVVFGDADVVLGSRVSDTSCARLLGLKLLAEEVCLTNSKSPKILFAGDSHAMALHSAVYAKQVPADALLISGHRCLLFPNLSYTPTFKLSVSNNCTAIAGEVVNAAANIHSIDTVVLVNYYSNVDDGESRYSLDGKPLSNKEAFAAGYDFLVSKLLELGKRVVFVVDVPHLKYDPSVCIQKLFASGKEVECRSSKEENSFIRRSYLEEVYKLKGRFPQLLIYDPTPLFCQGAFCELKGETKSYYYDTDHISVYGAESILMNMHADGFLSY
jgi:peptidoglycan/LPS O-acetylase OafA/YrhL